MRGLIIKDKWIEYILNGDKTWEIRGRRVKFRETIYLIKSGSGKIFGQADIVDCKELTLDEFKKSSDKHQIQNTESLPYKRTYAWILSNVKKYDIPIPYKHPRGAVIWVKFENN